MLGMVVVALSVMVIGVPDSPLQPECENQGDDRLGHKVSMGGFHRVVEDAMSTGSLFALESLQDLSQGL